MVASMTIKERLVRVETLLEGVAEDIKDIKAVSCPSEGHSARANRRPTKGQVAKGLGIPGGTTIALLTIFEVVSSYL
jgi:hypothetical protein